MSTEIHEAGNGKAVNRVPMSQKQPFVLPLAVSCNVKQREFGIKKLLKKLWE